jgi:hypothetical protein
MGDISEELKVKINNVLGEIEHSDLTFDEKTAYQQKVIQAKNCANGTKDKIDDISKVLLNASLHQILAEIRLPKKISTVVRSELKDMEKNITDNIRLAIQEHTDECFRRMSEYRDSNGIADKDSCGGCHGIGDSESTDGIVPAIGDEVADILTNKKKSGWFKWANDLSKQSPLITAIIVILLFQRYGFTWVEKLFGITIGQ